MKPETSRLSATGLDAAQTSGVSATHLDATQSYFNHIQLSFLVLCTLVTFVTPVCTHVTHSTPQLLKLHRVLMSKEGSV